MKRLNYNQLYYFYIIASLGSIKDACEKLHLTQPTISGQLKALEEDLGYKLFDRKYRKLTLNEMGKLVFKKIEKVFLASEELAEARPSKNDESFHSLRIGILKTVPNNFTYSFYKEALNSGKIRTMMKTGHLEEFIEMMKQDKLDVILSDAPYTCLKNQFKSLNLGANDLCAVGTPSHAQFRQNFPQSMNDAPFLQYTKDNPLRDELEIFFSLNNINPKTIGQVDDINLLIQMVKEGDCISIVPKESVRKELEDGLLINLGEIESIQLNRWAIISNHSQKKEHVTELLKLYLQKNVSPEPEKV